MRKTPIRVLLVDDSPIALAVIKKIISAHSEIEVVGTARHGKEALEIIPELQPDVICTDLHMPHLNGIGLVEEVMKSFPKPILVISSSVQKDDPINIFKLLEAGAIDIFEKPMNGLDPTCNQLARQLVNKIKVISGVVAFRKHKKNAPEITKQQNNFSTTSCKAVAIGASTGGPIALQTILRELPHNFPVPIFCIQHIGNGFLEGLVDWLSSQCNIKLKIAVNGELPKGGTVYFPPEKRHLQINSNGRLICREDITNSMHVPSITTTFESVANYYDKHSTGVLLTGMGKDGAQGMQEIVKAGGITIVQDESSSIVFGMAKEAIRLGGIQYILPVTEIAKTLSLFV